MKVRPALCVVAAWLACETGLAFVDQRATHETPIVVLVYALCVVLGVVVARWWVTAAPLVGPLLLTLALSPLGACHPGGDCGDDSFLGDLILLAFLCVPGVVGAAAGVAGRRLLSRRGPAAARSPPASAT